MTNAARSGYCWPPQPGPCLGALLLWDMLLDCSLKSRKQTNKKTAAGIFGVSVQHLLLPRVWAGASWRGFLPWLLVAALGQAPEARPGSGEVLRWQGAACPLAGLLTNMVPSSAVLLRPNPLDDMKMCFLFTFCPS